MTDKLNDTACSDSSDRRNNQMLFFCRYSFTYEIERFAFISFSCDVMASIARGANGCLLPGLISFTTVDAGR